MKTINKIYSMMYSIRKENVCTSSETVRGVDGEVGG